MKNHHAGLYALSFVLTAVLPFAAGPAHAMQGDATPADQICFDTPEGRVCKQRQALAGGTALTADQERDLGLVTVNGGCSGTLLNRHWVLTARHCVTVDGGTFGAMPMPANVAITARWAPGVSVPAAKFHDLYHGATNRIAPTPTHDIVLVELSSGLLEARRSNVPYVQVPSLYNPPAQWIPLRVQNRDLITQYGRGLQTLATGRIAPGAPAPNLGMASPGYNMANFAPTNITIDGYDFVFPAGSAVGHGGDSGGPGFISVSPYIYITGVQSTCSARFIEGAPIRPGRTIPDWEYASEILSCHYVSVEPFARQIGLAMHKRTPAPAAQPAATIAAFPGVWETETDSGGHFTLIIQQVTQYNPMVPGSNNIVFQGQFINSDGATQYNGTFVGAALWGTSVMTFNYGQPGISAGGSGTFTISPDGNSFTGKGVHGGTQEYIWNGTRPKAKKVCPSGMRGENCDEMIVN